LTFFVLHPACHLRYDEVLRKFLAISLFACALFAQEGSERPPGPSRSAHGTNYDPPPMPKPKDEKIPYKTPEEKPVFEWPAIDWGARDTWIKVALLVGSVLMARRAFKDMTE
jgi:hypothetical protein